MLLKKSRVKKPKSKARRVLEASINLLGLAYLLLLCAPQLVFAHSVSYHQFRVYSTKPINNRIYPILQSAEQRLGRSEINDPRVNYPIFLCPTHTAFAFFSPLARKAFAVNQPFVHAIMVNTPDVGADRVTTGAGAYDRRTLSGVIAHECTHTLLARRFGQVRVLTLTSWKQEGYCDFIAQETSFDQREGTKLLQQGRSDPSPSFQYFKAYRAICALKDHRHWSIEQIIDSRQSLNDALRE